VIRDCFPVIAPLLELTPVLLVAAGTDSCLDRSIGYFGPYATSHDALDEDAALHEEIRNDARALITQVAALRRGQVSADEHLKDPGPK